MGENRNAALCSYYFDGFWRLWTAFFWRRVTAGGCWRLCLQWKVRLYSSVGLLHVSQDVWKGGGN
jgi:hypothetical protein